VCRIGHANSFFVITVRAVWTGSVVEQAGTALEQADLPDPELAPAPAGTLFGTPEPPASPLQVHGVPAFRVPEVVRARVESSQLGSGVSRVGCRV
jgi:hypothetical protein